MGRRDWPLVDLEKSPSARSCAADMDSVSLVRYAEQCEKKRLLFVAESHGSPADSTKVPATEGHLVSTCSTPTVFDERVTIWQEIASRFIELGREMDPELVSRLLRCFGRVRFADGSVLQKITCCLPLEEYRPG